LDEPTNPAGPLPPKPDQQGPETRSPTGAETGTPPETVAQQGE
jgi:catalase